MRADPFLIRLMKLLENTGREFVYHDVTCPHSIFCQYDELNEDSFTFLADSFARQSTE
ncbi:MAG: hypothetical protein GY943_19550 [Chloroflexi bacterium]|nr:hypothetical protein [Chloroflexota bacterium]